MLLRRVSTGPEKMPGPTHTIRGRVTRMLLVSVGLVVVLLAVLIVGELRAFRDTSATLRAVVLAGSVEELVHQVQLERDLTASLLDGRATVRESLIQQRAATDAVRRALDRTLAAGNYPNASEVRAALQQMGTLNGLRSDVDRGSADPARTFRTYSAVVTAASEVRPGLDRAQDIAVGRGLRALYDLADAEEQTAQERTFLETAIAKGGFDPGSYTRFSDTRAARQVAVASFDRDAPGSQRAHLDAVLSSENSAWVNDAEALALSSYAGPLVRPIDASLWWANTTAMIDAVHAVQRSVTSDVLHRLQSLRQGAADRFAGYLVVALWVLGLQLMVATATVRSIVRPITGLARQADQIATRRLPALIASWEPGQPEPPSDPDPVRISSRASAEIALVAQALDRVQTTAYELAAQQAMLRRNTTESLANLGRRNQNLVRRQLGLISEFERNELDPKMLANMFELDHLATRMRRNAESLLVLVGEASPRRWTESIPLSDVVRAALSEVDDYQRVTLRRIEDVPISGTAISELAHMLAELIENGLAFSPPELEVEVYGRWAGQQYMIAVVDHGVGMSKDQLAVANARLRGEADFLVAPTRFLGHYVVGRLATRLGILVELSASPLGGIAARLLLPKDVIAEGPLRPAPIMLPATGQQAVAVSGMAQIERAVASDAPDYPVAVNASDSYGAVPLAGPASYDQAPVANQVLAEEASHIAEPAGNGHSVGNDSASEEVPMAVPASAAAAASDGPHTRNGLVKRVRSAHDRVSADRPSAPAAPAVERSPEQVSVLLASFRSGHERGEREWVAAPVDDQHAPSSVAQEEIR